MQKNLKKEPRQKLKDQKYLLAKKQDWQIRFHLLEFINIYYFKTSVHI